MCSDKIWLFGPVFKLFNPAGMLPKLNVMTIHHFLRPFSRGVVILAVSINGFDEITVLANKIRSIMRHSGRSLVRRERYRIICHRKLPRNEAVISPLAPFAAQDIDQYCSHSES
jgi:hypothetical protein